jgi:DMSO/TMAO reductase YedYZ molybdopterin-dependent catalytic subunit
MPRKVHRRQVLSQAAGAASVLAFSKTIGLPRATGQEAPTTPGLIVRSRRPLDVETPVSLLDSEFTPNDVFFVRSHFGEPAVNQAGWQVAFDGLFQAPARLGLSELFAGLPRVQRPAVLMCAGNGRALMKPIVPGLPWERGAVGQAMWSGIRLKDLVEKLGLKPEAKHLVFETGDPVPSKLTPPFFRSLPLERLMQDDVLLADRMNGQPLPLLHGGPVRLVVPMWTGNHWVKWVRRITASVEEAPGDFQRKSYKMPTLALPPSATPTPDQLKSVTTLNVKSQLTWPVDGQVVKADAPVTLRGSAWTGPGLIARVDVRTNRSNDWQQAAITTQYPVPGAWVRWELKLGQLSPGEVIVETRATDTQGQSQPTDPFWNRSGYLYNAIERITFQVSG